MYRNQNDYQHKELENLDEMGRFLESGTLPRQNCREMENLNRFKASREIESVIKSLSEKKNPGPDGEFYPTFKELIPVLLKLFYNTEEEAKLCDLFYKVNFTLIGELKILH